MHVRARGHSPEATRGEALLRHPLLGRVGRTPLVELQRIPGRRGPRVFAKVESANPGGSVKDRAARSIIMEAIRDGELPGRRLLDATSGNTGIAYAMFGAALGLGVTLCVPASASPERKRILQAFGCEVVETDPLEGSDGAIMRARALQAATPARFHYADQYSNPANPRAHERTTGPEILSQLAGTPLDLFVAGLGTSGTFTGVARFLRRASPRTILASVEPDAAFHGLEGLKHMASAIVPAIYEPRLADLRLTVPTEEAHEMARRLTREEGLFVGPSSGAAVAAALRAGSETMARTVVVVLPDGGERYLSDRFWGDDVSRAESPSIRLVPGAAEAIRLEAARAYPAEGCGALIGPAEGAISEAQPLLNRESAASRTRFTVSPRDYLAAEEGAEARGLRLLGFWHSHPDHPARPSETDRAYAWPGLLTLVIAVDAGEPGEMTAWEVPGREEPFRQLDLEMGPPEGGA